MKLLFFSSLFADTVFQRAVSPCPLSSIIPSSVSHLFLCCFSSFFCKVAAFNKYKKNFNERQLSICVIIFIYSIYCKFKCNLSVTSLWSLASISFYLYDRLNIPPFNLKNIKFLSHFVDIAVWFTQFFMYTVHFLNQAVVISYTL